MSSIKLKHSGGNSVSLNPPTSAPTSSDVAFKLPNADGSANQYIKTDGSGNLSFATVTDNDTKPTSGSYTSVGTYTGVTVTVDSTNVVKYEIMFTGVSNDGGADWGIRLGDSGGIESTGYVVDAEYTGSNVGQSRRTDAFRWTGLASAEQIVDGKFTLSRIHNNKWYGVGDATRTDGGSTLYHMAGSKELSGALTQINIISSQNADASFDGGHFKIITYTGTV